MQTQNFRNASKSALRKSKIYIYEQFLDKIFEIPKNLYIRTIIHTNNDHCSLHLMRNWNVGRLSHNWRILVVVQVNFVEPLFLP